MAEDKKKRPKVKIPPEAMQRLAAEIERLGDPDLELFENVGRYCYITHARSPLCRLGYRGELDVWDFAIYKWSTQSYAPGTDLFPLYDEIGSCLRMAMNAYNLR